MWVWGFGFGEKLVVVSGVFIMMLTVLNNFAYL